MATQIISSRHFFRRTARARAAELDEIAGTNVATVRKAKRGPYRYYVVLLSKR